MTEESILEAPEGIHAIKKCTVILASVDENNKCCLTLEDSEGSIFVGRTIEIVDPIFEVHPGMELMIDGIFFFDENTIFYVRIVSMKDVTPDHKKIDARKVIMEYATKEPDNALDYIVQGLKAYHSKSYPALANELTRSKLRHSIAVLEKEEGLR